MTVASMMQAFLVGLPVLLLVDEEPTARYVVSVLLIFCVCIAVIGFIFVPKVLAERSGAINNAISDRRDSNLGASIRASMSRDRDRSSRLYDQSVTFAEGDPNAANYNDVNDTVAKIRQAALEHSKCFEESSAFEAQQKDSDDVEQPSERNTGNGIDITGNTIDS